jgi:hypothetical protein
MIRLYLALSLICLLVFKVFGQNTVLHPPVIDMHVHGTNTTPADLLSRMKTLNIRYAFVANLGPELSLWNAAMNPSQFLPSLTFPCPQGQAAFVDRPCWENSQEFPDLLWLREQLRAGRIKGFGELLPELLGMSPADTRLEPYWQLAEEFDIPVAIHMGPGPPAAAYGLTPATAKLGAFRMAAGDPILLEDVLLRHKKLRLVVMHAGWPFLDSMMAIMYAHPNVYVDVGGLQTESMITRASYYRHLRGLAEGGFSKRIVFGSDFPTQVEIGINAIDGADFLSSDQKSDILCNNAARFLRLEQSVCKP